MPRGRKKAEPITIEAQIEQAEAEIQAHKEAIADLKKKLKELKAAKQQADMEKLMSAVKESGKTMEQVLEMLK